jgi:hypothetical protein
MFFVALLMAASQPSSIIPSLSDQQLCQSLQRTYGKTVGMKMGPATILKSGPNCTAKTLNNRMAVALGGPQRQRFVSMFMANAEANLCQSTDPTVVAFRARRWRWNYEFRFADGTVTNKKLACFG